MSNKLKKEKKKVLSPGYSKAKEEITELILSSGGINITFNLIKRFTDLGPEEERITEEEFFDIIGDLSDKDFEIYKISKVHKNEEHRAMMICPVGSTIGFQRIKKDEVLIEKEEEETATELDKLIEEVENEEN